MKKKAIAIAAVLVAAALLAAAVGFFLVGAEKIEQNAFEEKLLGKWAYIHDPDTKVAVFRPSGKAEFEKKQYVYTSDGETISLTDASGETTRLRYVQDQDQMFLYIKSTYVPMEGYTTDGILGVWICPEKGWTYEFTDKGTFMEDGVLTGYYFVDEESGTIRLVYEEVLEDTVFYYRLTEEGLFVEYPWLMVKMP